METMSYQAGIKRRANADTGYEYQYFLPSDLPVDFHAADPKLARLLEEATHSLGELNAYARFVPDIDFFIRMHETKEATASNKIEGTKTNIDEAVMREEDVAPERRDDWREVQNYLKAMNYATSRLNDFPLVVRLLGETHKVLLAGVRGAAKQPGELRRSQNWIGGATLKDARFIPPHHDHLPELLTDLGKFLNQDDLTMPILIKAGIAHYQFETIHPYLDGNGRLGRLLIILYLMQKKMVDRPVLYLSQFFAAHRQQYYESLDLVRTSNDLEQWLRFFLVGVSETAKQAVATLQAIMELRQKDGDKIMGLGRRAKPAGQLLKNLYREPIVSVADVARVLSVTPQSANSLVGELVKMGVLREITGFSRNRLFAYSEYLRLFDGGEGLG